MCIRDSIDDIVLDNHVKVLFQINQPPYIDLSFQQPRVYFIFLNQQYPHSHSFHDNEKNKRLKISYFNALQRLQIPSVLIDNQSFEYLFLKAVYFLPES